MARCNVCGNLLASVEAAFGDARCATCAVEEPAFERAVNYGAYTGVLRQLIHILKYERVRSAAVPLGRLTAEACLQLEGDIDVEELLLIPVPSHKARARSRGFNQAELISRAARRDIEHAIGRRLMLDLTSLQRVRFLESQVALSAEERRKQVRGAFKVTSPARIKGREILLIDDVLTTGATASECARELRHAGASRVWVATPARALGRLEYESIEESRKRLTATESLSSLCMSSSGTALGNLPQRHGIMPVNGGQRVGWYASRPHLL